MDKSLSFHLVSVLVCSPIHGEDMETLIKNADLAMYHSKEQGRNCYSLFTPMMKENAIVRMHMMAK